VRAHRGRPGDGTPVATPGDLTGATTALVIGIGNSLAGDDGLGPRIAEALKDRPGVQVRTVHQLVPELAAEVARASIVIFADASAGGDGVAIQRVTPVAGWPAVTHTLDPADVLALVQTLYGRCPRAFLVTAPGTDFHHGEDLSARARAHLAGAVKIIEALLEEDAGVVPQP
jgi:hydrogenase maturation protease